MKRLTGAVAVLQVSADAPGTGRPETRVFLGPPASGPTDAILRKLRHRSRMNTTTDRRWVDEAMDRVCRVDRDLRRRPGPYDRWTDGPRCENRVDRDLARRMAVELHRYQEAA